jgi:hypothetical protein
MTYLEARRIEARFNEYRKLAVAYWAALIPAPQSSYAWMAGPGGLHPTETDASRELRRRLALLQPEVVHWADCLGVSVTGQSCPAPAVGGFVIPFNLLKCVVDQNIGHMTVSTTVVLDAIDQCVGAAEFVKRRLLSRLLRPWCWLVDVPALIVGWPFLVMRKAGVPDRFVDSASAQVTKAILTGLLYLAGFAYIAYRTGLTAAIRAVLSNWRS